MSAIENVQTKFETLIPYMNERLRRLWARAEAVTLGQGGIKIVAIATGLSSKTISKGIKELKISYKQEGENISSKSKFKVRGSEERRKSLLEKDQTLIKNLDKLIPLTIYEDFNLLLL